MQNTSYINWKGMFFQTFWCKHTLRISIPYKVIAKNVLLCGQIMTSKTQNHVDFAAL